MNKDKRYSYFDYFLDIISVKDSYNEEIEIAKIMNEEEKCTLLKNEKKQKVKEMKLSYKKYRRGE